MFDQTGMKLWTRAQSGVCYSVGLKLWTRAQSGVCYSVGLKLWARVGLSGLYQDCGFYSRAGFIDFGVNICVGSRAAYIRGWVLIKEIL